MPHIRVENVSFGYKVGGEQTLSEISLQLSKGSFSSLVGRSGQGKSTLLKLMAGLLQPSEGKIFIGNERLKGPAEVLVPGNEKVAYLDQKLTFPEKISLTEILHYAMRAFSKPHRLERANLLLRMAGLEERSGDKPENLSGGQQQKLSMLYALAAEPELLLLDEPFSHLDELTARELAQTMFPIIKQWKTTTLMVSHLPLHTLKYAQHMFVMSNGRLIEEGNPIQLYTHARQLETAQLLGEAKTFTAAQLRKLFSDAFICQKGHWHIRPHQWQWHPHQVPGAIMTEVVSAVFCGTFWEIVVKAGRNKLLLHLPQKPENHIWLGLPDVVFEKIS